jgi:hypothetical protein
LTKFHSKILVGKTSYPYELYLAYLTHKAYCPTTRTVISYSYADLTQFTIETPSSNQLPWVSEQYYINFFTEQSYLSFNNLMDTIYWLMTQLGSIVIVSESAVKIATTTEVLRTIIFPFEYSDPYMLSLPKSLYNYIKSPFPCLFGVPVKRKSDIEAVIEC